MHSNRSMQVAEGRRRVRGRLSAAVACSVVAGLLAAAPAAAQAVGGKTPDSFIIGVGDHVRVAVWKNPELEAEVPVRPDGMISVPLVGDVEVAGLTPAEVQGLLTDLYGQFVTAPSVSVMITQINSRKIFILGEVAQSGSFDILQPTNLMQALAMAGGLTEWAKKDQVVVLREAKGVQKRWKVSINAITSGRRPEENLMLEPGDTIIVP